MVGPVPLWSGKYHGAGKAGGGCRRLSRAQWTSTIEVRVPLVGDSLRDHQAGGERIFQGAAGKQKRRGMSRYELSPGTPINPARAHRLSPCHRLAGASPRPSGAHSCGRTCCPAVIPVDLATCRGTPELPQGLPVYRAAITRLPLRIMKEHWAGMRLSGTSTKASCPANPSARSDTVRSPGHSYYQPTTCTGRL